MFDDNKQTPQPPGNLPIGSEPEDMFAGIEGGSQPSPVQPERNIVESAPQVPNALDAGLLKPKTPENEPPQIVPLAEPVAIPSPIQAPSDVNSSEQSTQIPTQPVYAMKEPVLGKVLLLVFLLFVLVGLGFGGYWFFNNFIADKDSDLTLPLENLNNTDSLFPEEVVTIPIEDVKEPEDAYLEDLEKEDSMENIVGDMDNDTILFGEPIDSDHDGLDDIREEELGTDPNKIDTDDDGLDDASEVLIWKTNPINPDSDGDGYPDGLEIKTGHNPMGPGKIFETEESDVSSTTTTTTTSPTTTL